MHMYMSVFACIVYVCMYFALFFGCIDVSACISMYLHVSIHCHSSPVVILERLNYIVYHKLQSTLRGVIYYEILFERDTAG